jgi:hypothetical protein
MLLADDFVGVTDSRENLQKYINVVCNRWRLKVNVSKSAVVVFASSQEEVEWMC